jgi:twinkle protein
VNPIDSKGLRELAERVAETRILRDVRKVDVERWGTPRDAHLLRSPAAFRDDVVRLFEDDGCQGALMPALKARGLLQFRPSEMTLWGGYTESFKTTFVSELFGFWACQGVKVAIASLEMPAPVLLRTMIQQVLAQDRPSVAEIERALEVLSEALTLYDITGTVAPRHLVAVMRYCAIELGCTHFLLDNLTLVLSVDNDKAGEHQQFIAACVALARETGMHVHLIAHCHKPENGDEGRVPGRYALRGTGSAVDQADNVIIVWRNKRKETALDSGEHADLEEADVVVRVDKQRHWGFHGQLRYWVDRRLLRFKEYGSSTSDPFL